jgi:hypothetical protein
MMNLILEMVQLGQLDQPGHLVEQLDQLDQ